LFRLVEAILARAKGAAFYGSVARTLHDGVASRDPTFPAVAVETLADALAWCWPRSEPGDCIVLSPGFSSHDQFRNFRHRGEEFARLVGELAQQHQDEG
jgi:UDP-N-acetylmuramoylalanine--D-glutamate ligase